MHTVFGEYTYDKNYGFMYKSNNEFEKQIRNIVREEINNYIPQFTATVAKEIESGVLSALCYDVQTIADVSIGDVSDMISSEKISSFVSGKVAEEIGKRIHNIKLTIA